MNNKLQKRFVHQGKKDKNYFEGWYIRLLNPTSKLNLACIFAYTRFQDDPHAFIQIYDGEKKRNTYYRFDINLFRAEGNEVSIGDNHLSPEQLILKLDGFLLDVHFEDLTNIQANSAMGFLANLPLQCYQEVVFMNGSAKGMLNSETIVAKPYMEKTFGKRFPKRWFWLQSNDFDNDLNFTLAGGHVPTLFFRPFGFFAIIQFEDKEWIFGTYNGSKCRVKKTENHQYFSLSKGNKKVYIEAKRHHPVTLVGPSDYGKMDLDVYEDLNAEFSLKIYQDKTLIYESKGSFGGYEWMF